ncbi:hypothetical protein AYI68_g7995 [Smittium mucronatum]|uniref:SH3 domain-containing protein n=1 Tax=Smittium mucronatum TaxID=133383 RepID=A0A1R0GM39_9FUNG|nr:hypothetical protein AYI68_g7995 [Smittium mucronatum]
MDLLPTQDPDTKNRENEIKLKSLLSLLGRKQLDASNKSSDTSQILNSNDLSSLSLILAAQNIQSPTKTEFISKTTQTNVVVNQSGYTVSIIERVIPVVLPTPLNAPDRQQINVPDKFLTTTPTITVLETTVITIPIQTQAQLPTTTQIVIQQSNSSSQSLSQVSQDRSGEANGNTLSSSLLAVVISFSIIIIALIVWMIVYIMKRKRKNVGRKTEYEESRDDMDYSTKKSRKSNRGEDFIIRDPSYGDWRNYENRAYQNNQTLDLVQDNNQYANKYPQIVNSYPIKENLYQNSNVRQIYHRPNTDIHELNRPIAQMMTNAYSAPPNLRNTAVEIGGLSDFDTSSDLIRESNAEKLKKKKLEAKIRKKKEQNQKLKTQLLAKKLAAEEKIENKLFNELIEDSERSSAESDNQNNMIPTILSERKRESKVPKADYQTEKTVYPDIEKSNKGIVGLVSEMVKKHVDGIWGGIKDAGIESNNQRESTLGVGTPGYNSERDKIKGQRWRAFSREKSREDDRNENRASEYLKKFKSTKKNSANLERNSYVNRYLDNRSTESSISDTYFEKDRRESYKFPVKVDVHDKFSGFTKRQDRKKKNYEDLENYEPNYPNRPISRRIISYSGDSEIHYVRDSETKRYSKISGVGSKRINDMGFEIVNTPKNNRNNKKKFRERFDYDESESDDSLSKKYDFSIRHNPPLGPLKAVENHDPMLSDELELEKDDEIYVIGEFSDGWILAILCENGVPGGSMGMLPRRCVFLSGTPFSSIPNMVSRS